jgi:hypothetical protein
VNGIKGTSVAGSIGVAITGFFALLNFGEWYAISVLHQVDDYWFGGEGPAPYYYKSSALYATVMFIWGVLFLINFSWLIWSLLRGKKVGVVLGFALSLILLLGMFVHGQIGLN